MVLLVSCFIFQAGKFLDNKPEEEINIKKIRLALSKLRLSVFINIATIIISIIFIYMAIRFDVNIIDKNVIYYIQEYFAKGFALYSENTFRIFLVIIFGMAYYWAIFLIPNSFIDEIVHYDNKAGKENNIKKWKCKLLILIPVANIIFVYFLSKKIKGHI
jgi:hypothetical protein